MGSRRRSTLRVLGCALLITLQLAYIKMAAADTILGTEIANIERLLDAERYADADSKALLVIEQAYQQNQVPADDFLKLGVLFLNASRFEVSKVVFSAALERYTSTGALSKMALTLLHLAISERHLSNYDSALTYVHRAMSIAQIERNDTLKARLNLELGTIQQQQGKIGIALEPLKQALGFFRDNDMPSEMSLSLLHIGDLYSTLNQTSLAHTYYRDALESIEKTNDSRLLGIIKTRLGALLLKTSTPIQAIESIENGLKHLDATDDVGAIAEAKMLLGSALVEHGDTQNGRELLQEAMAFAQSSGQLKLMQEGRLALARAYMKEQSFELALAEARTGTVEARKHRDLREQISFLSLQLNAFVSVGEFKKALDIQSVIQQLREALLDSENKSAIEGLQAEIEVIRQSHTLEKLEESKQLALAQAEQEKLQTTLVWSISLAALLFTFLIWSRYKQRQQTIILRREVRQQTLTLQEKNEELQAAYRTLEEVSLRDSLTSLYNRHYLESQLPGEIRRSQFSSNQSTDTNKSKQDLLCLLIDIDHFKRINDDYGHIAGDKVLTSFAQVLKHVFRLTDLIIRWGGEEFLVVCRQSNREELPELAERCREMVASTPFDIGLEKPINITCSIGFSLLPPDKKDNFDMAWERTFAVVDYALYAAKLSGRNGWVGVIETLNNNENKRTPIDHKFNFTGSRIATSFNNVASIKWPDNLD
ncbi:diguanylate cyclase [Alteromonas sp. IB21]|uniref:diguanylate cyclase domain-containing protein n=1 Tax=Alteromonas sp. IB21 TaxID=2779369 RepID=UPI0018E8441B|nr:diguanylate cyclase [Alteromonas sp. IB21]MBJ2127775.1 diguanylate cyclase [Alteromonas sp. IB21]